MEKQKKRESQPWALPGPTEAWPVARWVGDITEVLEYLTRERDGQ